MKIALTVTTVLFVSALAACGSSETPPPPLSRAAYSAELQQVGTSLVTALNSLGQRAGDYQRIETHVAVGQAALRRAAARLAASTPPMDARADNAKLVSGMRAFAAQLTSMQDAASRHDLEAVVAADRAADRSPAVKAMMAAVADLRRKGYKLGRLAPSGKD
jgi:hypothetical protein